MIGKARNAGCYFIVMVSPHGWLPYRLLMALLPYAGLWAYRPEASDSGTGGENG